MFMSTHPSEGMITFAEARCSSMTACFHQLQSLFQLICFFTSFAITALPKHCLFPFGASFFLCRLLPSNSAMVVMFIFTFPFGAQIGGITGALPIDKTCGWMSWRTCTLLYFPHSVASEVGKALNVKYLVLCGDSIHRWISWPAHFSFCFLVCCLSI